MKLARLFILLAMLVVVGVPCVHGQPLDGPTNRNVKLTSTNLPIVWLTVPSTVNHDKRVTARMKIIDNGAGQYNYTDTVAHAGQHVDYDGYIGLRYRGHSSYAYSLKKPYSFRPLDRPLESGGSWKKASLLGMPRDSHWALLAPFNDKSMMRDLLAFEIARPWMDYVPQGRYCEVIVNGIYYGVFILCEVVSKGKNRLDLDDPGTTGDALTGGYMVEVERDDEVNFVSRFFPVRRDGSVINWRRIHFKYKIPDYEDLSPAQLDYIHAAVDRMEAALADYSYRNAVTGECDYIDEMSFIDYQLIIELGHNVDGYRLSGKCYKHRDSQDPRFKMALWDMNLAFGNANYNEGWRTDTWIYQMNDVLVREGHSDMVPFWWYKLNKDKKYVKHLKERWAQYLQSTLRHDRLMAIVDSLAHVLTVAAAESRNSRAYPYWGQEVWPNYYIAKDYGDEVAYLKRWLIGRIAWMDSQLDYVVPLSGDLDGDGEVTVGDVNVLINILMNGAADDVIRAKADVNGDGEISVSDINAIIDMIIAAS